MGTANSRLVTVNADGSLTEQGGTVGGIIRNHEGSSLMVFKGGSKGQSIGYIELEAILQGIKLAEDIGALPEDQ